MASGPGQSCPEFSGWRLVPQLALPLLIYAVLTLARGHRVRHNASSNGDDDASECLPLTRNQDGRWEEVDAYRFWLVGCIIVGHFCSWPFNYMPASQYLLSPLLLWLETFSMPGLAFISGLCAHGPLTWGRMARLLTRVILPYHIARIIKYVQYENFTCVGAGYSFHGAARYLQCLSGYPGWVTLSAASDAGIEWYLFSLVQWRLAATVVMWLWPEALLALSFGIGILSGYFDVMSFLTLLNIPGMPIVLSVPHRTMSFLPFFAAGLLIDPTAAQNALRSYFHMRKLARVLLIGTFGISIFVVCSGVGLSFYTQGAVGDFNYDYITVRPNMERPWELFYPPLCGPAYHAAGFYRGLRYMLSFGMIFLVWAAAWPSSTWLAAAGRHTMYPYLLHQWPLIYLDPFLISHPQLKLWILGYTGRVGMLVWVAVVPFAFGITHACTWPWVRRIFGPLIEPDWILCGWTPHRKPMIKGLV